MPDIAPALDVAKLARLPLLAAPALKPCDAHGDAAMKVFAVPELLEHILYLAVISQQAEDRVREKQDRHDLCVLKMWPMPGCGDVSKGGMCLFRIQRVNKTFRDTIQGSTKLKQLIYLAPRDNAKLKDEADLEEGRLALHKPLTAFLWGINFRTKKELLDLDAHKDAEEGVEALVTVLRDSIFSRRSTTPYKKIFGKCPKKWRRAQASWRKIKVCNARVPVPVRVVVQGEETWPDHALPMGDIVWDLDEEATLEHVFDLLSEFLKAVEDLRHGKDLHERSRAKKLLQFDERASSDRHQLESQLAIELKALEDALDREKSTRDDEVARLDAELRDMELKAFGIKASSSREALESQLTIERSYLGREVDEQGFDQGDEITETIRMRLKAVETRRAQRTASESK